MTKTKIIIFVLFCITVFSCSDKLSYANINKPFYNGLENNARNTYQQFNNLYPKSFEDYYKDEKYEVDRSVNFRNRALDTLNLMNKNTWLLIEKGGTNYIGVYEESYIISDGNCFFYHLPQYGVAKNLNKLNIVKSEIGALDVNNDIYMITKAFENGRIPNKINITATNLIQYHVISVHNRKIKTYEISSVDYIVKKWN